MSDQLAAMFSEMDSVLGICPCCGDVFRLSDARPHLSGHRPESVFDRLEKEGERLSAAEERLSAREQELRDRARILGLRQAKRRLRKIDPVFSGKGLDPQDVKVIFDPVEYVVFDGLKDEVLRQIRLMAEEPRSREVEGIHKSIQAAISKGNIDFQTLRVTESGTVESS